MGPQSRECTAPAAFRLLHAAQLEWAAAAHEPVRMLTWPLLDDATIHGAIERDTAPHQRRSSESSFEVKFRELRGFKTLGEPHFPKFETKF